MVQECQGMSQRSTDREYTKLIKIRQKYFDSYRTRGKAKSSVACQEHTSLAKAETGIPETRQSQLRNWHTVTILARSRQVRTITGRTRKAS